MLLLQADIGTLCDYASFAETVSCFHCCMPAVIEGATCLTIMEMSQAYVSSDNATRYTFAETAATFTVACLLSLMVPHVIGLSVI